MVSPILSLPELSRIFLELTLAQICHTRVSRMWISRLPLQKTKLDGLKAARLSSGEENEDIKAKEGYEISMMTPLAKILWRIAKSTFISRDFLLTSIYPREIHLLHALLTGDYLYSFAHLMIDDIWDMYEQQDRRYIPYGNYISEILCRLGAVFEDENVKVVPSIDSVMSVGSFGMLEFSESPTEHIIYDRGMEERITFPNQGTREAPPQPQPTNLFSQTYQDMPPQTPVPSPNVEMTNLFTKFQNLMDKQSSIFQKQYDELKTMVSNIQKQMEHQASEAERREQEKEKLAEETEKLAKEREKHAQIRAHAIIWDVERQRYFYEMEQEQLRMAWNQLNGANSVDEYQFPQISRASLHPPQEGSPYYDPTQGDEIPKAFQPLYEDIYGPKRKKLSSP
uniref:uncharacterized protein LOC122606229 n=1 Tax=Erigeron canadensis TaxID=72917 RepID=UPI001CB8E2B7|nr:uncharacterized protein LOC122606229 [Erigeron canadensis]